METNTIACNLAFGAKFETRHFHELKHQLELLINFYTDRGTDFTPPTLLNYDFSYFSLERPVERIHKCCGVGTAMVCYDTDGAEYPCQFFIPLTMSPEHLRVLSKFEFSGDTRDEECKGCVIESVCPTCYGSNHLQTLNPFVRDKSMCMMQKLVFLANCVLQSKKILAQKTRTDRELFTLRAVNSIYPVLSREVTEYESRLLVRFREHVVGTLSSSKSKTSAL